MIDNRPLEAAIQALSIFNTIAFLWLGLTVLLNAEQRSWGTWVAGGGLVVGGAFFALHSALFSGQLATVRGNVALLWPLSWLPFVALPYLWYLVMAWYTGVIERGLHRKLVVIALLAGVAALAFLLVTGPLLPRRVYGFELQTVLPLTGLPATLVTYAGYSAGCVLLALIALWRPHDSQRFMGDVARRRARPWLVAASFTLLAVSIAVSGLVLWFLLGRVPELSTQAVSVLDVFDFTVTWLLTLVGIFVGRAVASYEIFTGKVLPRGGLRRQWRNSLVLATSFSALVGVGLVARVDTIVLLVLAALLITVLYAVHSWRVYVEREQSMQRLRPFVASDQLFERLVQPGAMPGDDLSVPFRALCADVLDARVGFLVPMGTLAGPALAHPGGAPPPLAQLGALRDHLQSPDVLCIPVDADRFGGAVWAIPLWSERGPLGLLLLGAKRDGALYTQEEIELARATGERLVDTQVSAAMAQRLMVLQRDHLAETQVIDRRARRLLHDEVLPQLHAVLLSLGAAETVSPDALRRAVASLVAVHQEIAQLLRSTPPALAPEVARRGPIGALRQAIEVEFGGDFDGVVWDVDAEAERLARELPSTTAEVLFYAAREGIRNAARHARNGAVDRQLRLTIAARVDPDLTLVIEDDGVGLDADRSTGDSGGHGLALHTTMMAVVGGTLTTESVAGSHTRLLLRVPLGAIPVPGEATAASTSALPHHEASPSIALN